MMFKAIGRNGMLLGIFALITTLVIAGTWLNTRDRIAAQQRAAEERALLEIVPLDRHDNAMLDDTLPSALMPTISRISPLYPSGAITGIIAATNSPPILAIWMFSS